MAKVSIIIPTYNVMHKRMTESFLLIKRMVVMESE